MFLIVDILFLFVVIFIAGYFNYPNFQKKNYITQKLVIFLIIYFTQFTYNLIMHIKNGCKIELEEILYDNFLTSIFGVIGLSLYNDLSNMNVMSSYFSSNHVQNYKTIFNRDLIISFTILFYKLVQIVTHNGLGKCYS